ncbi:uncharacterized protein STEHIDRAFT_120484 [Stereum hirsutum FP-91666 SS1]|uniref:uncharacterized protein n=1 Tax=Stereum hirsutum (strain FP-91666) TaxID=721885 RepID=UPI000440BDC3|nr:uncharacterized protein STEHIDRAFT_120484 [Stereum hirsutum FP-91666 SS1]EIM88292.1 hypothetical protein STEHIDRAFT_120484 [Stereum hirsutum FP-91666 SS1]
MLIIVIALASISGVNARGADDVSVLTRQTYIDLWVTRLFTISGYGLLVFDYLLTLSDEVAYIWPSRWSPVKIIYLANRYGNLSMLGLMTWHIAGDLYSEASYFCFVATLVTNMGMLLSFASIRVLILLRAWALWIHRRHVLAAILVLFLSYSIVCSVLLLWGTVTVSYSSNPYPIANLVRTCVSPIPDFGWVLWLPSILLETALFGIILRTMPQYGETILAGAIYRDGAIYFVCSMGCSFSNLILWAIRPNSPLNLLPSVGTLAAFNIAGQRLVVSLRRVHARQQDFSTGRLGQIVGDIDDTTTEGEESYHHDGLQQFELSPVASDRPPPSVSPESDNHQSITGVEP